MIQGTETRKRLFPIFVREHSENLEYTYNHLLTEAHREYITFEDWCNFAFEHSTVNNSVYYGLSLLG
jgi:hypothetical protein